MLGGDVNTGYLLCYYEKRRYEETALSRLDRRTATF